MRIDRFFWILCSVSVLTACTTSTLQISSVPVQNNLAVKADIKEDIAFKNIIAPYKSTLDKEMNQKISSTLIDLTKSGDNSNLGNLLADFTFSGAEEWTQKNLNTSVDAALINIGGIRNIISKGDITLKNVYEVMPFENEVIIIKMKGEDLQGLFDYYSQTQINNPVSHIYIETENKSIKKALINGKSVDSNRIYYIATSDYLALGGDNMTFFSKGEFIPTGIKLRDLFIDYFKKNQNINPQPEIRLNFRDKKK